MVDKDTMTHNALTKKLEAHLDSVAEKPGPVAKTKESRGSESKIDFGQILASNYFERSAEGLGGPKGSRSDF